MPKMGNKMAGSMAAIARGMTSVIQKTAISNKTKEHSASCTDTEALQLYSPITDGCQDYEKRWSTQFLWRHVLSVNDSGQSTLLPLTFVLITRGRGSSSSGVTRIRMMLRKFHRVLLRVFISGSALSDWLCQLKVHALLRSSHCLQVTWFHVHIRNAEFPNVVHNCW